MRPPAIALDQLAPLPEVYRAVIPPTYEDRNGHMNVRSPGGSSEWRWQGVAT